MVYKYTFVISFINISVITLLTDCSVHLKKMMLFLWVWEKVLAILTCCCRLIEVCSPQNLHHTHMDRLIFHQAAHGNFHVLKKKSLEKVCLYSPKLIGQIRTDVAPEWIIWNEKISIKWTFFWVEWWLNIVGNLALALFLFKELQYTGQGRKKERKTFPCVTFLDVWHHLIVS